MGLLTQIDIYRDRSDCLNSWRKSRQSPYFLLNRGYQHHHLSSLPTQLISECHPLCLLALIVCIWSIGNWTVFLNFLFYKILRPRFRVETTMTFIDKPQAQNSTFHRFGQTPAILFSKFKTSHHRLPDWTLISYQFEYSISLISTVNHIIYYSRLL